ncbi:MAG: TetR/AcrR family transcriptional regulator [Anaerovoracaceae bacterium]|jgi:AcrR family transcriptional regulator
MKQAERAEITRSRILRAAMEEFGRNGYRGGTIGNICKTGINKGLIYHYFASKDALYLECVKISCGKLLEELERVEAGSSGAPSAGPEGTENAGRGMNPQGKAEDVVRQYMKVRMDFYGAFPHESRIVFGCLLDPPEGLQAPIREIMTPLEERNLQIYGRLLSGLKLRSGVTEEKAKRYFILSQEMFNAYFSSPAMQKKSLEERIALHEQSIPEILDCMLYGIAEKRPDSEEGRQNV